MPSSSAVPGSLRPAPSLWRDADFRRLWAGQTASQLGEQATLVVLPLIAVLSSSGRRRPAWRLARGGAGAAAAALAVRRRVGGPVADPHGDDAGRPGPRPGAERVRPGRPARRPGPAGPARGRLRHRIAVRVLRRGLPGVARAPGAAPAARAGQQRPGGQPVGGPARRRRAGRPAGYPAARAGRGRVKRAVLRAVVPARSAGSAAKRSRSGRDALARSGGRFTRASASSAATRRCGP